MSSLSVRIIVASKSDGIFANDPKLGDPAHGTRDLQTTTTCRALHRISLRRRSLHGKVKSGIEFRDE